MHETCFKDRGIDRLCMKRVSRIGALINCVGKRVSEIGDIGLGCSVYGFFVCPFLFVLSL